MPICSRLVGTISSAFVRHESHKLVHVHRQRHQRRQMVVLHRTNSVLYTKFTVRDPILDSTPLTSDRAYDLLLSLNETERTALKTALDKYESQKVKEEFVGILAKTRWRSKFGRPAKMPLLGEVDPTGSYCKVPDDFLKKKLAALAKPPPSSDLQKLFLINAVPFIGFGFLDNFTMIIAGDSIEHLFGTFMCISTMAAAALGNTISDVLGIGSAFYVERLSELMGLRPPKLTEFQLEMKLCRRVANAGRIIGITVGCIVGMLPLLFMDNKPKHDETTGESTETNQPKEAAAVVR